jgi:hypothetical protein
MGDGPGGVVGVASHQALSPPAVAGGDAGVVVEQR